jgi:hypothetical protein
MRLLSKAYVLQYRCLRPVAYLGFVKGGGPIHAFPLPSPFPSPLAHTPPSPPSPPLVPCPSLPPHPAPPSLPSLSPFNGGPGYNPGKIF